MAEFDGCLHVLLQIQETAHRGREKGGSGHNEAYMGEYPDGYGSLEVAVEVWVYAFAAILAFVRRTRRVLFHS